MATGAIRVSAIRGLQELIKKFERLNERMWEMPRVAQDAEKYLRSQVPPYPPPPPNSTYHRTGDLGRSIHTEVQKLGAQVVTSLSVGVDYGPWVVDERRQARVHRGRWWTLQEVLRKSRDGVVRLYEDFIRPFI